MGIFGDIVSAIFGKSPAAAPASTGTAAAGNAAASGGATAPSGSTTTPAAGTPAPGGATGKPMSREQVEAMIEQRAEDADQDYNWQESIVDLMKLLKLDSSLTARKQLATELGYTGAKDGSAEMNIWLHKQVMTKLMESGGTVPDSQK